MEAKTCVVTGASRGIGRGIAERFGEAGCDVAVNYRSSGEAAREVVETIEDAGGSAIAVRADVTEPEQVQAMAEDVHEAFGTVDVLVNNAGINQDVFFEEMTHEEWDTVLDIKPFVPAFDVPEDVETGWMDASAAEISSRRADDRFQ